MGAITCAPEQNFTYTGYIKMRRMNALKPDEPEYILLRARDERIAPVMLEVRDEMKGYIADLLGNSFRETFMLKRFHFNQWCELRRVDVLDESFEAVKTVKQGQDWRPFIGEIKEAEGDGQEQPDAENDGDVPGGVR